MNKQHEFAFNIGDRVRIVELENQIATVQSIHIGTKGVTYEVAWFQSGKRETCYLFAHELRLGIA